MIIRRERPDEAGAVDRLHDEAFSGLAGRPVGPTLESQILRGLRADPGAWVPRLSLVLVDGDELLGHVVASRGRLQGSVPVLGLGPVAIRPSAQRRGLGTTLVHAVVAAADALDEAMVVLLGNPDFYSRIGFVLGEGLGVTPPDPQWAPHFQVRTLAGYDAMVHRGAFTYAPAFDLAD